jgi:LysR family hydrogen peroxide-inducible transcriptional activator
MYLKDVAYFLALTERGSFREAADACGVSQPTLSVQLAKLEGELGVQLVERGGKGARLTPAGERAVGPANRLMQAMGELRAACADSTGALTGTFHLGIIPTSGAYLLPLILPVVRKTHPDVKLFIREEWTADLLRKLARGDLDAAIVSLPIDEPALSTVELFVEPFKAIVPSDHPLAKRDHIGPADLATADMLLLEHGHCLRGQTTDYCDLRHRPVFDQATGIESLRQMVAAGLGVAVLPALATRGRWGSTAGVKTIELDEPAPRRTIVLAWRRSDARASAWRKLGDEIHMALAALPLGGPAGKESQN